MDRIEAGRGKSDVFVLTAEATRRASHAEDKLHKRISQLEMVVEQAVGIICKFVHPESYEQMELEAELKERITPVWRDKGLGSQGSASDISVPRTEWPDPWEGDEGVRRSV